MSTLSIIFILTDLFIAVILGYLIQGLIYGEGKVLTKLPFSDTGIKDFHFEIDSEEDQEDFYLGSCTITQEDSTEFERELWVYKLPYSDSILSSLSLFKYVIYVREDTVPYRGIGCLGAVLKHTPLHKEIERIVEELDQTVESDRMVGDLIIPHVNIPVVEVSTGKKNDCTVRTFTSAFGISLTDSENILTVFAGKRPGTGPKTLNYLDFLDKTVSVNGKYLKKVIPLPYKTIGGLLRYNKKGIFIAVVSRHTFAIINGTVYGNNSDGRKLKMRLNALYEVIPPGSTPYMTSEYSSDFPAVEGRLFLSGRPHVCPLEMFPGDKSCLYEYVVSEIKVGSLNTGTIVNLSYTISDEF